MIQAQSDLTYQVRKTFIFLNLKYPLLISYSFINRLKKQYEIVEGLYFHCSLSVCLSVCVCVFVSVNKAPAKRMHQFGYGFS